MIWLILALALLTRLYRISTPPGFYFDEVYNAFTTLELVKGNKDAYEWFHQSAVPGTAYGWTHPPLAKLISAVGVLIFGPNALGWRIANVLVGTATIYLVYLLARVLWPKNRLVPLLAALFLATDGLLLVQSRINMNDVVAAFFVVLAFLALACYQVRPAGRALLRLGLILGLLVATKWTGLYALALFGGWLGWQLLSRLNARNLALYALALVVIPAAVYLLAYSQYFWLGGTWSNFVELQNQMWWYNTGLKATHTYQSDWWTWPLLLRPVWYFVQYGSDTLANIYAMGNPVLWWLGVGAILWMVYTAISRRDWRLWLVVAGYTTFWLPWARAPRIMFLYHYLPSVPFLSLSLAYVVACLPDKYRRVGAIGVSVACIATFVYFFPHWTGIPLPRAWSSSYFWLPSWR